MYIVQYANSTGKMLIINNFMIDGKKLLPVKGTLGVLTGDTRGEVL